MFGIGTTELLIVGFLLVAGGLCFGGLVVLLILIVRASRVPKKCPKCGADLRR